MYGQSSYQIFTPGILDVYYITGINPSGANIYITLIYRYLENQKILKMSTYKIQEITTSKNLLIFYHIMESRSILKCRKACRFLPFVRLNRMPIFVLRMDDVGIFDNFLCT